MYSNDYTMPALGCQEEIETPAMMLFQEVEMLIRMLPDADLVSVMRSAIDYHLFGFPVPPMENPIAQKTLQKLVADIERNKAKYQRIVERNRKNGKKGGRPSGMARVEQNPF